MKINGARYSSLTKVKTCVVCGKKIPYLDGGQLTHRKTDCREIYQKAYYRYLDEREKNSRHKLV